MYFEEYLQPRTNSKFYDLMEIGLLPNLNGIYRKDVLCPEGLDNTCTPTPEYWNSPLKCHKDACDENEWHPDAVFLSHAHADHVGYLPYLGDIPVYCSNKSKILMKAISQIGNLQGFDSDLTEYSKRKIGENKGGFFPKAPKMDKEKPAVDRTYNILLSGTTQNIATNLDITGYDVCHSIPGSMCSLIKADNKQILYTGDLRFHGRNQPDLSPLHGLKPDVMITEGTRVDDRIPDDENEVEEHLKDMIERTKGLVMIGFAWKDLERYETVKKAAIDSGRIPVFDARVAYLLARLGTDIYADGSSVFLERTYSMLYSPADYTNKKHCASPMAVDEWNSKSDPKICDKTHVEKGVKASDLKANPEKYVLHLPYFRFKNLLDIGKLDDPVYIRAQCEPFNPEMEISEDRMINWLKHFGINEENNYEPYQIHASGHASGIELQEFIEKVEPKLVIPIHTLKPKLFYNDTGTVKVPILKSAITI
jgi:ribonuclease J